MSIKIKRLYLRLQKSSSFQPLLRYRHLIPRILDLNDAQFRLWDLLVTLYDWDEEHIDTFNTVYATQRCLAELLDWSPTKVCEAISVLAEKGLLKKEDQSFYKLLVIPVRHREVIPLDLKQKILSWQQDVAPTELNVSPTEQNSQMQPVKSTNNSLIGSSRVVSRVINEIDPYINQEDKRVLVLKQKQRTQAEYEEIVQKRENHGFSAEEMRKIDDSLEEEVEVSSAEQEKELVETYFDGNWEEYGRHLRFQKRPATM